MFFTYLDWIIWVRNIPASEVDCCLSLPNWWGCTKLLEIAWNYNLSPITFSINLPSVFNNTIGWKDLGELYDDLFGLEIIINVNNLKCEGQCPRLIQALVILTIEVKQISLLIIYLRIFYEILSGLGVNELL